MIIEGRPLGLSPRGLRRARRGPILNSMVQYSPIDRTLAALADPTRRRVLERLGVGSATITELAEPAGMSLTGMKKHVRVLEDAELVTTEKVGRRARVQPRPAAPRRRSRSGSGRTGGCWTSASTGSGSFSNAPKGEPG